MSKRYRHEQILKLVRARRLDSQAELGAALRAAGVEATQVTLSRDLKELGVVKTAEGYAELAAGEGMREREAAAAEVDHIVAEFVRDVRRAGLLLVVKTDPGAAATVGGALDRARWSEVAGSVAGDDTVLVVCEDARRRGVVERRLRTLVGRTLAGRTRE